MSAYVSLFGPKNVIEAICTVPTIGQQGLEINQ